MCIRDSDNIVTSCPVEADPYLGAFPEPSSNSCDYNHGNFNNSSVNLTPGTYCGWFNFNNSDAHVSFSPGLYVIKNGGWNVNGGTWTGDGVTFYFADSSKIQFNSGVDADLKAPTEGDYANVIFTEKPGLGNSHFILNDSKGFDVEGIIYLPSRDFIFNSGSNLKGRKIELVTNTLTINQGVIDIAPIGANTSGQKDIVRLSSCLLYTSPSPRDATLSRMPSSA